MDVSANHKTHCAFSLSVNIINSVQQCQWQTHRRSDPQRALREDTWCWKSISVMESSFATSTVLYHTILYYCSSTSCHFL